MIADFLKIFVEFLRAYFSMLLVFVVLGGLALVVLSVEVVTVDEGRPIAHVDVILAATGMAITFAAGYAIPTWFSGWAKPSYPNDQERENQAVHKGGPRPTADSPNPPTNQGEPPDG